MSWMSSVPSSAYGIQQINRGCYTLEQTFRNGRCYRYWKGRISLITLINRGLGRKQSVPWTIFESDRAFKVSIPETPLKDAKLGCITRIFEYRVEYETEKWIPCYCYLSKACVLTPNEFKIEKQVCSSINWGQDGVLVSDNILVENVYIIASIKQGEMHTTGFATFTRGT